MMLELEICRPSSSRWANPLHMIRKSNGEWRPCGDFRKLNSATVPDKYPLPRMQDFTYRIANCRIFSKINLVKAFFQIPVAADRHKMAITTLLGFRV